MKTEPRVIDLGNGYGKVVRYFVPHSERPPALSLSMLRRWYRLGYITRVDFVYYLRNPGYTDSDVDMLIRLEERR